MESSGKTSENIKQMIVFFEFDDGTYAGSRTQNKLAINTCASLLQFSNLPDNVLNMCTIQEMEIPSGD
jgi:hypothetical protein